MWLKLKGLVISHGEDLRAITSSNTVKRLYSNFAYNFLEFSAWLITRESEWPELFYKVEFSFACYERK